MNDYKIMKKTQTDSKSKRSRIIFLNSKKICGRSTVNSLTDQEKKPNIIVHNK